MHNYKWNFSIFSHPSSANTRHFSSSNVSEISCHISKTTQPTGSITIWLWYWLDTSIPKLSNYFLKNSSTQLTSSSRKCNYHLRSVTFYFTSYWFLHCINHFSSSYTIQKGNTTTVRPATCLGILVCYVFFNLQCYAGTPFNYLRDNSGQEAGWAQRWIDTVAGEYNHSSSAV
jgi:hypothetical protein